MENFSNLSFTNTYLKLRNYSINYLYTNILLLVRFEKKYLIYDNNIILFVLNLFPYFIVDKLLFISNIDYLYKKDDIIYYSKPTKFSLSPIVLGVSLTSNNRTIDIKDIYNKYGNNVPLQLIVSNEKLLVKDEDTIYIKYISSGKICEKSFNYKNIKLYFKIDLLK